MTVKVKTLKIELEESEEIRRQLKIDLDELNQTLIKSEEQLYESKTIQLELLEQLKDLELKFGFAEEKIEELKKLNYALERNQAIYIAKKNDKIDKALSTYLNNFPEREQMRILFLRETEGVYRFGTKRVYVKIEKGNQIFVRVGGGYMHIDEFIYQYTDTEVEKIQRSNPLDRFQNKLAVQNISANKATGARETSPIRERQRSPKRGSPRKVYRY